MMKNRSNIKDPKKFIIFTLVIVLVILAFLYLFHPTLNIKSGTVFLWLIIIGGLVSIETYLAYFYRLIENPLMNKIYKVEGIVVIIVLVLSFGSMIVFSPIFNAKEYASRISVKEVSFDTIDEVDFNKTPIIDRDSSEVLGDRVMGQMPELVSQFTVSDEYTQISYLNSVYRVTPLEYADTLKYFMNRSNGIPAYILVNSTTGEAKLVKLEDLGLDGMRYVPSAMFNENLNRKLQLEYPTTLFGSPSFEIDEEGHPYYVCTTYDYKGVGTKRMVTGVILFDPISGESIKYDDPKEAPTWVDRIYPESLIMEELENYGSYQDGFINSIFGQRNVYLPSEGYNYLEKDGDIWIYTGLTSVNSDSANLGFAMVNLRTHEALEIASPGADETSAMRSAMGNVSDYGYIATFPLLVNISNNPVYLMSLKDDAGLIKMYAMVDATDYQKVVSVPIEEGLESLKRKFISDNNISSETDTISTTIIISSLRFINTGSNTTLYLEDSDNNRYKLVIDDTNADKVAFIDIGDTLSISYIESEIREIIIVE